MYIFKKNYFLKNAYPFDPSFIRHAIIAAGLTGWIFLFLFFTEPLDVSEFLDGEKLVYAGAYGLVGGLCYVLFYPIQGALYRYLRQQWTLGAELVFICCFSLFGAIAARLFYLYVIVPGEPYPYTLGYFMTSIILPALSTILPIVIVGRFAIGKYYEKKRAHQKIEISGEGSYENLHLHADELLYIQSSDNYVEVFFLAGKELKKTLIRNRISTLAQSLPELMQVHRSYLVNPFHMQQLKMVQGKPILLLNHHEKVPVSKTYLAAVKSHFNSTTN